MTDQDEIRARIAALRKTADELEQGLEKAVMAKPRFQDLEFTIDSGTRCLIVYANGDSILYVFENGTVEFVDILNDAARAVFGNKLRLPND